MRTKTIDLADIHMRNQKYQYSKEGNQLPLYLDGED